MKAGAVLFFAAIFFCSTSAQQQTPAPPPQTARQALIEMITGGQEAVKRHLTVEMQKSLQGKGKDSFSPYFATFDGIHSSASEFQAFETGDVLFAATDPKTHEKFEVHVDSDDLSGDTDDIDLSFHQFRDGLEEDIPYAVLLSRFTVGLKRQENIWRLNEISANIKLPLGDPKLLEKFERGAGVGMVGGKVPAGSSGKVELPPDMPIEQVIRMVAFAESSYAMRHPETGFTCTLADLAEQNSFQIDQRVFNGEVFQGYKFSLSGCQGKPSETFHLIAEPVSPGAGFKAYCTDATHNVRTSDDGRGSTCVASGKVSTRTSSVGVVTGIVPNSSEKKSQEK
jgi:hypothetical protein